MSWLAAHWLDLIQTTGIIGSLFFANRSSHNESKARLAATLFKITERHGELWGDLLTREELSRILKKDADPVAVPLTKDETVFLTLLFLHLNTAYASIQAGILKEPQAITLDIQAFFSLRVPAAGWAQMRYLHEREFVAFVEKSMRAG